MNVIAWQEKLKSSNFYRFGVRVLEYGSPVSRSSASLIVMFWWLPVSRLRRRYEKVVHIIVPVLRIKIVVQYDVLCEKL